ncbi:MAG: hypothetical protein ACRD21_04805 [Vicinamibacteria bacterium]
MGSSLRPRRSVQKVVLVRVGPGGLDRVPAEGDRGGHEEGLGALSRGASEVHFEAPARGADVDGLFGVGTELRNPGIEQGLSQGVAKSVIAHA